MTPDDVRLAQRHLAAAHRHDREIAAALDRETRGMGCLIAMCISLAMWAGIIVAVLWVVSEA